jgi:hypothetical protein
VAETLKPLGGRKDQGWLVAEVMADFDRLIVKHLDAGGMGEIVGDLRRVRRRLILRQGE